MPLEIEWKFFNNEITKTRPLSAEEKNYKNERVQGGKDNIIYKLNLFILFLVPDLKRSNSAASLFSTDYGNSYIEEQTLSFTIIPQKTSILPNETQKFTVAFSPLNSIDYCMILRSNIMCLTPKMKNVNIKVKGKGLLSTYYFEIEKSTYLKKRPDGVKKCNSTEYANPKIIEFESVGIGALCVR